MTPKVCKDCKAEELPLTRDARFPGPRCFTHHRTKLRVDALRAAQRRVENTYEISGPEYDALYAAQGGRCFICGFATGKVKRLAVDHDHRLGCEHPPDRGCRKCIRGLLCGPCNQLIGRYGIERLLRAVRYLEDPPARKVLANIRNTSSFT